MLAFAIRARRRRRLSLLVAAVATLAVAVGLALFALRDTITLFLSPSDLDARLSRGEITAATPVRVGGLVKDGSVARLEPHGIRFVMTDTAHDIPVTYAGVVPDLFREGQGVVAEGRVVDGRLQASTVLAKHDERYMPREVADALKKQGRWQETSSKESSSEETSSKETSQQTLPK